MVIGGKSRRDLPSPTRSASEEMRGRFRETFGRCLGRAVEPLPELLRKSRQLHKYHGGGHNGNQRQRFGRSVAHDAKSYHGRHSKEANRERDGTLLPTNRHLSSFRKGRGNHHAKTQRIPFTHSPGGAADFAETRMVLLPLRLCAFA
jgi:hypothetical protein